MAPLAYGTTHGLHLLAVLAQQAVDNGRLSHTRGTEERNRPSRGKVASNNVHAFVQGSAYRVHGGARGNRLDGFDPSRDVVAQIGLVEHDDRLCPA
jgi:hypothetical protein